MSTVQLPLWLGGTTGICSGTPKAELCERYLNNTTRSLPELWRAAHRQGFGGIRLLMRKWFVSLHRHVGPVTAGPASVNYT